MDEQQLQAHIEWAKRGNLSGKSAARYFELSGLAGSDFDAAMAAMPVDPQPTAYVQQENEVVDPYAGFEPMQADEGSDQFNIDLGFIEGELLKKSEEEAVGVLRNKYNRYGFKFDEAVPGFDYINVTAPNGKQQKFVFGRDMSEEDQQYFPGYERSLSNSAADLVSFMNKNMIEDTDKINSLAKANYLDTPGYLTKEDVEKDQKSLLEEAKRFQADLDLQNELTRAYDVAVMNGDQETADKLASELRDSSKDLENRRAMLEEDNQTFQANFGRWYDLKANQGTWIGAAMNWLGEATDGIAEGFVNEFMDAPFLVPQANAMGRGISIADVLAGRKLTDEERRARKVNYTAMEDMMKLFSGTTDEYTQDLEIRAQMMAGLTGATAEGMIGLIKSAPAFMAPGKILRVASMGSMVLNDIDKEMSGKEFEGVTEDEKWLLKAPIALTTSVLEEIGFRNATQIKTIAPRILMRALGKVKKGSKIPPKTLAEYIEQDVKNSVSRGALAVGSAFFAEAETGLLQELSTIEIKRLWNLAKDRADFDIPSTAGEYFKRVMKAAYMEGIGGFVLGSRSAISAARSPFSDEDLTQMMQFSNEEVIELRRLYREGKVSLGEMTREQAQAQGEVDRKIHEVAKQVPGDASVSVQKQIFRKLQKEAGLKDAVARKGARMSTQEQKELEVVRREIEDISSQYERMTPEEKAQEMREITQPVTPTGGVLVEAADGSTIEITAEEVSSAEAQKNESMEQAPESREGVQLSLFDETVDQAETPQAEQRLEQEEDQSDFAEVKVSEATAESMGEAGFSAEFQSLISKVKAAVGDKLSRGKGDRILNHRTNASLMQAIKNANPGEYSKLQYGQFVMGFVETPKDGGPQTIHLLDTNSSEFTELVKEAATKLGRSYKIDSAVELVTEELVTHYMLQDFFGVNGTKRDEFFEQLEALAKSNPALQTLIEQTKYDYSDQPESKQREEVIAAFFNDYIKSPAKYRNIWQRIADWFNSNFRKGTRVINNESDLMDVARNVSNIISGVSVDVQIPDGAPRQPVGAETSFAKTSGSNYLQNETIYYMFDRNAGVEFQEWYNPPPPVAQKVRVNDYFHFRNWYNKMTANQKYAGTVTEMYFVKDGKKHPIKPPKPKVDREGNLVSMPRFKPTTGDIKRARAKREADEMRIMREQYSILMKEAYQMFKDAGFDRYLNFMDFVPEGAPMQSYARIPMASGRGMRMEGLDFEGYIIAKKNIKALSDTNPTEDQLKRKSRIRNPEMFNLTNSQRVSEQEPGTLIDREGSGLSFAITKGEVKTAGVKTYNGVEVVDPEGIPGVSISMSYDLGGYGAVTIKYGDKEYTIENDGGIPGLLAKGDDRLSVSHSTDEEREKTLRLLKYYHVIYTSSEDEIRDYIESTVSEMNDEEVDIDFEVKKAMETKSQLVKDGGKVSAVMHVGELRALPGRPALGNKLMDIIIDSIEIENNPDYTREVLNDLDGPLQKLVAPGKFKVFVKHLNGGMDYDPTNLDHVKRFVDYAKTAASFILRQNFIRDVEMYKSGGSQGTRKKIYAKFPEVKGRSGKDIWEKMVDPYIWENMGEDLMNSRVATSKNALGAVIIDLEKLFSGPDGKAVRVDTEGDFGKYIGGADKVVYFSKKAFLNPRLTQDNEISNFSVFASKITDLKVDAELEGRIRDTIERIERQIRENKNSQPSPQTLALLGRLKEQLPKTLRVDKADISDPLKEYASSLSFSISSGRLSSKVADASGSKGISVNQLLQVAGKASKAEQAVLKGLIDMFPGQDFIPKEDFDQFFEGKMLQPLEEEKNHANYGLDRLLGKSYRQADAVTVPFLGNKEIYGTAGIFEDHFGFPVHAHIRMFTHPNDPGVRYVSELQSDTYQKGLDEAYDGTITDEVMIEDAGSDELGIAVQNLEFLKYIVDNYDQYRTLLVVAAGGENNAINDKWWDDLLQQAEIVPEGRVNDAPNVASLLSNALNNDPNFNVRAFRAVLKYYALSELKAPIGSTDKQIEAIIDDAFNKYPFIQEGEKSNLGRFATDLIVTIDYTTMSISSLVIGEDMQYMSQEERLNGYKEVVEEVEKNRKKKETEKVPGIPSAEKSWEKQLIRYAVRKAQENGEAVVRFPTEKTAADIQWWDASDSELQEYMSEQFGVDGLAEMPDEFESEERAKQAPLRKRYRDLPKTLKAVGLESRVVQDQYGNKWYEVDTPPSDQRMIMFSTTAGKNNMGDVGGATWEARQRTGTEEWTDLWLTRLQDKYRKVFQLQEDVAKKTEGQVRKDEDFRMAEELMYGKAANDLGKLDHATDRITMTLLDNNLKIEELDEYMYALHAQERNAVIRERTEGKNQMGSGMSDLDAQKILNNISEEKKQQLEEAASIVREILQDTRETMVKLGLESQETIDAFEKMFKDYVPLQGKAKDEEDLVYSPYPNGGTGFSVSGATTKKARGRFTQTTNIVAQAISQNAAVHVKGRTNEAMNALYNLAMNNPNPSVWQVLDKEKDGYKSDDPNIVSVRVNGVQKAIRFKDASYAQSLRKMNMPQTNYFVKAMGSINSWLRAAFTSRNPEFILSNFSRDIQSAVFNASAESEIEGGFLNGTAAMNRIFKLVGPSLKTLVKDEVGGQTDPLIMRYYEEFKEDGGKTGWAYQRSLEDIAADLQIDDSGKTAGQKIIGGVKGALEFVEGMNDAFENSIRLSSYIAAREGGVSREKAAQFAKNITVNFNKQGEWGAAVNATYLFFNASVQGTARLGRSLVKLRPPERPDGSRREWYERATTAQKAAGGMVIMNALLTLLNRAASEEDEDGTLFYNKIPDYVKERNMIIMRPDGENYWKIPMPYGYNIFANIGTTAVEVASGDKQAMEGLAFMAMSVVNAFSPISFGQAENLGTQFAKTSIPTAFKPFFEAFAFNETYFGGPVKAEQYPFGTPKPNSSMSFRSPEEIKQFFSWLNEATGGSEDVPGIIDINPDGGWYIFEYFLGGTGRFVTRSIETGRKIVADRTENPIDLDFNDIPFARIVYGEPSKYYDMQLFKDREVEIKQLVAEYKENRIPDAGDRYKGIGQLNEDLKKINKALKLVRAEKRAAKKIKNYGERVSEIQRLMEKERKLVMMFNQRYEQFRGED